MLTVEHSYLAGIGLWILTGLVAFILARLIRPGRTSRWLFELLAALIVAATLGLVATALDFGGLREPDWRAAAFAFGGALAAVGLVRLMHLARKTA